MKARGYQEFVTNRQSFNHPMLIHGPENYSVSNNTLPSSDVHFSTPPLWMRYTTCIVCLCIILFGGISNLTTLIAFARSVQRQSGPRRMKNNRRSLWQRQYVNIVALALVDAVVCVYSCAIFLTESFMGRWIFPAWFCRVHWSITSWAFYGGVHMLMLVGYDRYLIVKHGINYERVETWRKLVIRTGLYGLVEPAIGTPLMYVNYFTNISIIPKDDGKQPYICYPEAAQLGYVYPAVASAAFMLPVCAMAYFYFRVYRHTRANRSRCETVVKAKKSTCVPVVEIVTLLNLKNVVRKDSSTSRHDRASKILKFLFGSLVICYAPYIFVTIILLFITSGALTSLDVEWWMHLFALTQILGLFNNALNPLLYAYTMPKLHETMVGVWHDSANWALTKAFKLK